jgi:hypothetical protein
VTVDGYFFSTKALEAVAVVAALFALWTFVSARAGSGALRRAAMCAVTAAVAASALVGWAASARHDKLAARAAVTRTAVPALLAAGWSGAFLAGTAVLFLASTLWGRRGRRMTVSRRPARRPAQFGQPFGAPFGEPVVIPEPRRRWRR